MASQHVPTESEIEDAVQAVLAPAWAVDVASGAIRAANGPGRALLGLAAEDGAPALDRAMPALTRLGEIAAKGGRQRATELTFWTRRGVVTVLADVAALAAGDGGGLLLVTAVEDSALPPAPEDVAAGRVRQTRARRLGAEPARLRQVASAPPPDKASVTETGGAAATPEGERVTGASITTSTPRDADTLREIARRIRAGRDVLAIAEPGSEPPAATEQPAPSEQSPTPPEPSPTAPVAIAVVRDPPQEPRPPAAPIEIAKLAHELRTPLAAIAALAEIMRDERLGPVGNPRYRGYASDIHDSARHALDVLNAGLDREQDAVEPSRLDFTELDIAANVTAAASSMRPLADRANLRLSVALGERLPRVVADRRSVRQILLNLISNALKFTPAGGEIRIATIHRIDGPLHLEVADTGSGMSEEAIARVLATANEAMPAGSASGGLGYGLPLVKTLAAANGADVAIASIAGQGTRVTLTFPRDRLIPV